MSQDAFNRYLEVMKLIDLAGGTFAQANRLRNAGQFTGPEGAVSMLYQFGERLQDAMEDCQKLEQPVSAPGYQLGKAITRCYSLLALNLIQLSQLPDCDGPQSMIALAKETLGFFKLWPRQWFESDVQQTVTKLAETLS